MRERRRAAELSSKHEALRTRLDVVLRDQRRLVAEVSSRLLALGTLLTRTPEVLIQGPPVSTI